MLITDRYKNVLSHIEWVVMISDFFNSDHMWPELKKSVFAGFSVAEVALSKTEPKNIK